MILHVLVELMDPFPWSLVMNELIKEIMIINVFLRLLSCLALIGVCMLHKFIIMTWSYLYNFLK